MALASWEAFDLAGLFPVVLTPTTLAVGYVFFELHDLLEAPLEIVSDVVDVTRPMDFGLGGQMPRFVIEACADESYALRVEAADDAAAWTEVASFTAAEIDSNYVAAYVMPTPVAARYLRVWQTATGARMLRNVVRARVAVFDDPIVTGVEFVPAH